MNKRNRSPSLSALSPWLLLGALAACKPNGTSALERAEFGVMFGGQCQERDEFPFELDATKLALGFVLRLREPATAPLPVHWEVSKPGPRTNGLSSPLSRRTELFDSVLPAGQRDFQKPVVFSPGDQLGTWNIRVTLGDHVAIDRPFWVFDPTRVKMQAPADAGLR